MIYRQLPNGESQYFVYDTENQLAKAEIKKNTGNTEIWEYAYDPFGRRLSKERKDKLAWTSTEPKRTHFVWDGTKLLQEYTYKGNYTYIYTGQGSYEPLAQVFNNTKDNKQYLAYFHTDQIGIPKEMTDQLGNLLWFGEYTAWGKLYKDERVYRDVHQPFRLQNQYCDEETGLHYNFFRYYEPDSGRFVNQDPIGLAGGHNLYQFAPNSNTWIDPLGLSLSYVTFPSSQVIHEVTIQMQGGRGADFKAANIEAGILSPSGNHTQKAHKDIYGDVTWHHADYDPTNNTAKMQLVTEADHRATLPHRGSVADFEKFHGVTYDTPEAKQTARKINKKIMMQRLANAFRSLINKKCP